MSININTGLLEKKEMRTMSQPLTSLRRTPENMPGLFLPPTYTLAETHISIDGSVRWVLCVEGSQTWSHSLFFSIHPDLHRPSTMERNSDVWEGGAIQKKNMQDSGSSTCITFSKGKTSPLHFCFCSVLSFLSHRGAKCCYSYISSSPTRRWSVAHYQRESDLLLAISTIFISSPGAIW